MKLLTIEIAVTQNFGEQPRSNGFTSMNWHYC